MTLAQLMEKRAAKVRELRQILDAASGAPMTPEQDAAYKTIETECRAINDQIARQERLDALERSAAGTPLNGTGTPDFDREVSQYSLVRAIAKAAGMNVDASRETEIAQELERRTGRKAQGFFAPSSITHVRRKQGFEQRVMTSGGSAAGVIFEDSRPELFIDALRASMVTASRGATTLSDLNGPVSIPAMTAPGATAWMAENAALTPADRNLDKVTMTMKTVGALTEFSRNVLIQSSPDIEDLLRRDFAAQLAIALDAAALVGGGANEPDGIIARLTDASALGTLDEASWPQVLAMIATIESANAAVGSLGWVAHPRVVQTLRSTVKVKFGSPETQDAGAGFVMDSPNELAGFGASSTTSLPLGGSPPSTGTAIFGDFSSLLIGYYSGIDILVNPYASGPYERGNVSVRGLLSCDVAVRHLESFTAATDVPITV